MTNLLMEAYNTGYIAFVESAYHTIKRRDTKNIAATLKEARPMLEVEQRNLDADEFMLNTPTLTYDLRQDSFKNRNYYINTLQQCRDLVHRKFTEQNRAGIEFINQMVYNVVSEVRFRHGG